MKHSITENHLAALPGWVPEAAQTYIDHTQFGRSIRKLATRRGCHASTVLRQVRRIEARRDDPLVDAALTELSAILPTRIFQTNDCKDVPSMNQHVPVHRAAQTPDKETLEKEGRRILRRLCEPGACLAVARDMEKAVVVREGSDGRTTRTAVIDRPVAQAMALKDWISCDTPARISRYRITTVGRAALKRLLAASETPSAGFGDCTDAFLGQHGEHGTREIHDAQHGGTRKVRYNCAESPVAAMARRKDKDGKPFLSNDLVNAAERLREDFELAQMGPRVTQNWERFLTGGDRGAFAAHSGTGDGPGAARDRVNAALAELGPGLGDVALRVCCFLEGLEAAEKRMGWSARSGKVVLRIALQRLRQHYDRQGGNNMIG